MSQINYSSVFKDYQYLGNVIPLEKWLQADLTEKMKTIVKNYVDKSRILFTVPILKTEVLFIEIMVRSISWRQSDFSDIIHRSMPYPVFLIQNYQDKWYKLSIVSSHENAAYSYRKVVDNKISSRWVQSKRFEYLLVEIKETISKNKSWDVIYKNADSLIQVFNYYNRRNIYINEFDDLLEEYERQSELGPATGFSRLHLVFSLLEMVKHELYDLWEESSGSESERIFDHINNLELFLDQCREILCECGEAKKIIKINNGYDTEYGFVDDYEIETVNIQNRINSKEKLAMLDYVTRDAFEQILEELGYFLSDESLITRNEQTVVNLLQKLLIDQTDFH